MSGRKQAAALPPSLRDNLRPGDEVCLPADLLVELFVDDLRVGLMLGHEIFDPAGDCVALTEGETGNEC